MNYVKEFLAYVIVVILLCMDFFSEWEIWTIIPKKVLIIILIIGLFISFVPTKKLDMMRNFWLQMRVMLFIVVVILVLPAFGGKSTIGLALDQPFFIMIVLLSFLQLRMQWKRAKQELEKEEELKKQQEKLQGKRKN